MLILLVVAMTAFGCGSPATTEAVSTAPTGESELGFVDANHPLSQVLPPASEFGAHWELEDIKPGDSATRTIGCGTLIGPVRDQLVATYTNQHANSVLTVGVAVVADNAESALDRSTTWTECVVGEDSLLGGRVVDDGRTREWDEVSIEFGVFAGDESLEELGHLLLGANNNMRVAVALNEPASDEPASFDTLREFLITVISRIDRVDPDALGVAPADSSTEQPAAEVATTSAFVVTADIPAGMSAADAIAKAIEIRDVPTELVPESRIVDLGQLEGAVARSDLVEGSVLVSGMFVDP